MPRKGTSMTSTAHWGSTWRSSSGRRTSTPTSCSPAGGPRPSSFSAASSPAATAAAVCAAASTAAVASASPRPLRGRRRPSTCPQRIWRHSCSLMRGEGTDTVPRVFVVAAGTVEV
ncbi:hypothetical protein GHT09_018819 [Marmota monax]|uniref:Uncharacterized protein n=1 Tax=Marmota monax TaxID=9995 RepID=A0A834UJ89_MARMO|nr:hypothetical protein GHT09_018819 [Marmota monax]